MDEIKKLKAENAKLNMQLEMVLQLGSSALNAGIKQKDYNDNLATLNDDLKAEVQQLKQKNERLKDANFRSTIEFSRLKPMIHSLHGQIYELKGALRKCSPTGTPGTYCRFCKKLEHADDCEYVRLCGGAE